MREVRIILFVLLLVSINVSANNNDSINTVVVKKVLILGNSIVKHKPAPTIGWKGNWGMAASVKDSDFVHILIRKIKNENKECIVKFMNIAILERTYTTYNLDELKFLKKFKPDLVVIKISENVTDSTSKEKDFLGAYKKLIKYLDPNEKAIKVIVDGFWDKPQVNKIVKQVAMDGNYEFVSICELSKDDTNMAKGKFDNPGVAMHPSDKGMRLIAERIWSSVKKRL